MGRGGSRFREDWHDRHVELTLLVATVGAAFIVLPGFMQSCVPDQRLLLAGEGVD